MKIAHEEYLKRILEENKLRLRELEVNHRVSIGRYDALRELFNSQIDSIERQLKSD